MVSVVERRVSPLSRGGTATRPYQLQGKGQWLVTPTLVLSDVLLALFVWYLASELHDHWGRGVLSEIAVTSTGSNVVAWIGLRALLGLYPGYGLNQVEELRRQTYALTATLALVAIFALAFKVGDLLSRLMIVLGFLSLLVLAPLVRHFVKRRMMRAGWWGKPVVVIGAGETGANLVQTLQRKWNLGFRPVAIFEGDPAPAHGELEAVPFGGTLGDAIDLARKQSIDTAIFAVSGLRSEDLADFIYQASLGFRHVIVLPNIGEVTTSAVIARNLGGTLGLEMKHNLLDLWPQRVKRMVDIGCAVVGGGLVFPLFLMISLLVWLEFRKPTLYKSERLGRDGRVFTCFKFRTMIPEAETRLPHLLEENGGLREEYLRFHKLRDDPRITPMGRFLRRTSLDELPQIWNVLRGEMSLVGPRPYNIQEGKELGPLQSEILRVSPGITGVWQVSGRNDIPFSERIQMDRYYVRNWSIWLDFLLLARTVMAVVSNRGAY